MKKIKLIAFDIDGTLIPRGSTLIPNDTKKAIQALHASGILIVVATGRTSYFIQEDVKETIHPDFYVTINGQLTVDNNLDTLYGTPINLEETHLMINTGRNLGFGVALKNERSIDVYHDFDHFKEVYLKGQIENSHYLKNMEGQPLPTTPTYGVFMIGDEEKILTLQDKLIHNHLSYAYPSAYEAFDKNIGKANGLEQIVSHYGVSWDEVMVFGDAHNDISMIQQAAIGVAMGNASDDCKAAADFVTLEVNQGGIVHALKNFGLLK